MLRAESLAAESIFRGIFSTRSRVMAKKGGAPTKSEIVAQICKDSRAVAQAGRRGVRVAQRPDQEEPAWRWPVHAARLAQDEGREEAATKAREGINPFTKEKMIFKAKPASKKVRALPLKSLKAFVN
jgi:hypothetical protein